MFCILLLTWWTGSLLQRMRNVTLSLLLEMFMSERRIIFRTNTNFVLIIQFNKHFRFRLTVTNCACKDLRRCFWNDISALHECWNTNISWLIQSNSISSILSEVFEVNLEVSGWMNFRNFKILVQNVCQMRASKFLLVLKTDNLASLTLCVLYDCTDSTMTPSSVIWNSVICRGKVYFHWFV